jgi:hypothetical protein
MAPVIKLIKVVYLYLSSSTMSSVSNLSRTEILIWSLLLTVALIAASRYRTTATTSQPSGFVNTKEDESENPVLVLGLPRSGSLAVHNFFTCNGVRSSNYCCSSSESHSLDQNVSTSFPCGDGERTCGACVFDNFKNGSHPFQGCGDYQVYSQFDVETGDPFAWFLPQYFTLPVLHESYPESTWILNRRNSSKQWATNVLHWYSVSNRLMNSFGIEYHLSGTVNPNKARRPSNRQNIGPEVDKAIIRAENATEHERRLNELQDVYQRHLDQVRAFAQANSHALIEINVDDPLDARNVLARSFPGTRGNCFDFDAPALDNDWKDFSLKV